jgi:hypothetical protein
MIEKLQQVESGEDEITTATLLFVALSRKLMEGVRKSLEVQPDCSTECQIVDYMSSFLTLHQTSGRRLKGTQNTVDEILVAATYGRTL